MKLSKNFNAHEFACKGENCCGHSAPMSQVLIDGLQTLRDKINEELYVKKHSGFRCNTHNADEGGAEDSQHPKGTAADASAAGYLPKELAAIAATIPCFRDGGIGIYKTFVHLDVRKNGPARWRG